MLEHEAVVNFLESMRREPGLTSEDKLLAVTTISFDIAVLELYLPLLVGARILLGTREEALDGVRLGKRLEEASVMQATPAGWRLLLESGWQGQANLKALCGGEALPADLAGKLGERCGEVWNLYGPTETTVWSAVEKVAAGEPVWIGRPIANTQIYVLDGMRKPVPVGVVGELYIGGTGLARGYWRREELTAERFVENPFRAGEKMYRTGDLGRWRGAGKLECLGRVDQQVKVRGYRIELGEIEARLSEAAGVKQAVVAAKGSGAQTRLAAYVTAEEGAKLEAAELREHLRRSLPEYMLPSAYVTLERLPLTPNGKVDRRALPEPDASASLDASRSFVAPRTPTEHTIAAIWSEVLGRNGVGVHDNFFELGGHSLLVAQVHSRLRDSAAGELTVVDLFRYPTVSSLATYLDSHADSGGQTATGSSRAARRLEAVQERLKHTGRAN
jgi:acyl-coenzyme A synthetase/AMP-(fatty) acid ligase